MSALAARWTARPDSRVMAEVVLELIESLFGKSTLMRRLRMAGATLCGG